MADRYEDMRTFTTIVETGGVNAAAASLGIAKSAVSRRLSDLEDRIGTKLVERTTRRFEATAQGRTYYDRAKQLLAEIDALDASFRNDGGAASITVSAPPLLVSEVLVAVMAFRQSHPEVTVAIGVSGSPDAAIAITTGEDGERKVGTFRRVLVAAPSYLAGSTVPGDKKDLRNHHGIAIGGQDAWHPGVAAAAAPASGLTVADGQTALAAAIAGGGIASLPEQVVACAIADGLLERLPNAIESAPVGIGLSVRLDAPAVVHLLADHLAKHLNAR